MFSTSVSIFPSQNGSVFTCCLWQIFSWRQASYIIYMLIHHLIIYSETSGVGGFNWTSSLRDPATNSSPSPFWKSTYQQHTPLSHSKSTISKSRWFHPTLLNPKQVTGHLAVNLLPSTNFGLLQGAGEDKTIDETGLRLPLAPNPSHGLPDADAWKRWLELSKKKKAHQFDMVNM